MNMKVFEMPVPDPPLREGQFILVGDSGILYKSDGTTMQLLTVDLHIGSAAGHFSCVMLLEEAEALVIELQRHVDRIKDFYNGALV